MANTYNFPSDKQMKPRTDNSVVKFIVTDTSTIEVSEDLANKPPPFIIVMRTTAASETVTLPMGGTNDIN